MLIWVFASIIVLCMLTFRSWRAAFCISRAAHSGLRRCPYALMAILGIGLKVYTLPVAALGVGIGVDYGIYLASSECAASDRQYWRLFAERRVQSVGK